MWENLRSFLREYVGIGWTATGHPISLGYLARIDTATPEQLLKIADELGIEVKGVNNYGEDD